jgi:hypothetical protein
MRLDLRGFNGKEEEKGGVVFNGFCITGLFIIV